MARTPELRLNGKLEHELHGRLAEHGIRLFRVEISASYGCDGYLLIHGDKTTEEWRKDVRTFLESERNNAEGNVEAHDTLGHGESTVPTRLYQYLRSLGYCDVNDVVSDVYEGAVAVLKSRVVDHPIHAEQENGFGHYGCDAARLRQQ